MTPLKQSPSQRFRHLAAPALCCAAMLFTQVTAATGQEESGAPGNNTDRYSVSQLGLNFDVPESPAFTVLDLNPQNVTRSATPRDFAASVINGLDRNGNFQSGLALEFNPWGITNRNFFVGNDEIPVSNDAGTGYADGDFTLWEFDKPTRLMRNFIYRTAVSLATTKGAQSDDDALRLAVGLRLTPWDPGDSRLIMGQCLIKKVESLRGIVHLAANADAVDPGDGERPTLAGLARALEQAQGMDAERDAFRKAMGALAAVAPGVDAAPQAAVNPLSESDARKLRSVVDAIAKDLTVLSSGSAIKQIRREIGEAQDGLFASGSPQRIQAVTRRIDDFVEILNEYYSAEKKEKDAATDAAAPIAAPDDGGEPALPVRIERAASVLNAPSEDRASPRANDAVNQDAAKKAANKIVAKCKAGEAGRWSGSSWDVSFAPSWISKNGSTSSMKWNGGGIWSSLSLGNDIFKLFSPEQVGGDLNHGEDHYAQVILHGRYRFGERVKDEMTMMMADGNETTMEQMVDQDTWLVGARLRFLFPAALLFQQGVGVSFEGSISNTDVSGKAANLNDDTFYRFAAVPTLRIAENVWIDVAFGTETGRKTGNEAFVLSSIKYGYGQEPWPSLHSATK